MSRRPMPVIADQPPAPEPSSAVVWSDGSNLSGIEPAAVDSIEEIPPARRDNPFVAYVLAMKPEEEAHLAARSAAADEGRKLYGDESSDAWLAALQEGTHPLCRVPEPGQRAPLARDERALVQRSLDETPAALQTLEEFLQDAQALWDQALRGEDFIRALGGGAPVHSGSDPDQLRLYLESLPACAPTT